MLTSSAVGERLGRPARMAGPGIYYPHYGEREVAKLRDDQKGVHKRLWKAPLTRGNDEEGWMDRRE